jgi:poly-gamma-glutamate synthesis protein (capsule biosynthesis protein)
MAVAVASLALAGPLAGRAGRTSQPVAAGSAATVAVVHAANLTPESPPPATPAQPTVAAQPTQSPFDAIVPVASFWTTTDNITLLDVTRLWAGRSDITAETQYNSIVVAGPDTTAMAARLGFPPAPSVRVMSADQVKAAVRASPATLGLLPAEDVSPDVRALTLSGIALFGPGRIKTLDDWPLLVPAATTAPFSLADEWTLAAGGDVNLDRSVYVKAVKWNYGPDFPWSGGHASIGGYECCGLEGTTLAVARATGDTGALAQRFSGADLALVNLEGSAPNDFVYRPNSLVFTFDPALLAGLGDAGIDAVSLANNHIRNGGDQGVVDTCANLDSLGIGHTGAGANVDAARAPAWLVAGGLRIAVLGYSAVGHSNWATTDHPGAAPLNAVAAAADIRAARAAGADLVIVMPHWGQEYSYALSTEQKNEAAALVAAGADLVLGSHSHWVGAIQSIDRPQGPAFVDYSLGDLLFDLNHDLQAQEGVIATMTFSGKRLVQVDLDPTIMVDRAQVALLDPAGGGQAVLDAIRRASRGLIGW